MGFNLLSEGEEPLLSEPGLGQEREQPEPAAPLAPEDDEIIGIDVDGMQQQDAHGADIPQGQVVIAPERGDHLVVNGVEIFKDTALATMREACTFYNLSTSGSRDRCFKRLFEHQKKLELQIVLGAAREAQAAQERLPRPQHLAEPPDEELQMRHNLTHLPFADWCPSCIAHRSRPDRQERTGAVKDSGTPTVSFDFAYTKAVGPDGIARNTETVIALVMVDSVTNYVGCVPVKSKSQTDVMVRELLQFTQVLGQGECVYLCDNEPAARQLQKLAVRARQALGLPTRDKNPAAYSHGNSLCENTIQRVRDLAGTLMHRLQDKLSTELSTDSGLWSWAMRHAAWLLNRFAVVHGATPYELVYNKVYKGRMTEFAEPAFSYVHTAHKGNPKWQRVIILGKTESQDTYVVFTGKGVMLSRSVRRIATDWKSHMGFYIYFNAPTWCFKTGFGSRIIPTRRSVEATPASDRAPIGPVLPSALHDADGEAVRKKAQEELREESELKSMEKQDHPAPAQQPVLASSSAAPFSAVDAPAGEEELDMSFLEDMVPQEDLGNEQPQTPPMTTMAIPPSPRASPTSRAHDEGPEEDHSNKKAKLESSKKQRIEVVKETYANMIRAVKVGTDEYYTMDNYDTDYSWENEELVDDVWMDEDSLQFSEVPEELWSNAPTDKAPGPPEQWIDKLADQVEISRLLSMGVLQKRDDFHEKVTGSLTTRFVYDWRLKSCDVDGVSTMKWMRRSRFVAREFANTKRHDTYSPATGSHTNNLIPILFLQMWSQLEASGSNDDNNKVVLASLDIKDAFLQVVPQENVVEVQLHGTSYVVLRNLPGQRLGARAWYWFFRNFATDAFKCSWSDIQPCIGKCAEGVFMVHVDDLLFTGNAIYWRDVFLPTMQEKFSISHNVLDLEGSEISFLKRRFVKLRDGLLVVPGTTVEKVLGCFEKYFGAARIQKTPCDAGIQQEDMSKELGLYESGCYRSIIGLLLYLARDRVDIMFTIKELATSMSKPTLCSLQRLRKLMGYLRFTGDMGMKLSMPEFGKGKRKEGCESEWILETFTDADWSSNRTHRKSTSCAVHFLNGCFTFASSRTQKVISLSSAESELHSMVSGCCDGIFIKRCAEFLFGSPVQHFQWTDNSAARQLVARQGVGRIRHLSGKILWIQQCVLSGDVSMGQVPTLMNFSDIGTKCLPKGRLNFLLHEIGAMDPATLELVGEEEHAMVVEQQRNREAVGKLIKFVKRMSLVLGIQGLEPVGVEGAEVETCKATSEGNDELLMVWFFMAVLLAFWVGFAIAAYCTWKRLHRDLYSCWTQVAEEDAYVAEQAKRIDGLVFRCNEIQKNMDDSAAEVSDRITEVSNELSMTHDYTTGLHYSIVEYGGFLRNGLGLSREQWSHLNVLERANLVSSRTMGSVEYMRLVRQRVMPVWSCR